MRFETKIRHKSEKFPGVEFTISRIGVATRASVEFDLSTERARVREVLLRMRVLADEETAATKGDEMSSRLAEIRHEMSNIDAEYTVLMDRKIKPAWVKAGLIELRGIEDEDGPLSIESLNRYGPKPLFEEIFLKIQDEAYLTEDRALPLSLPSISSEQADGRTNGSIAPPVGATATT